MTSLVELSQDDGAFTTGKAQAHLTLLRMFCGVYDIFGRMQPLVSMIMKREYTPQESEYFTNHYLHVAHYRYTLYLDLLASLRNTPKETWPLPQWDVALMMHTHMLSPVNFANDIGSNPRYSALSSNLDLPLARLYDKLRNIDHSHANHADRDRWLAKYRSSGPYEMIRIQAINGQKAIPPLMVMDQGFVPKRCKFAKPPPFSIDLVEAVKRQIAFARKITAFMNLIRVNATEMPVLALDIDLFWHTHQLTPSNYLPWCAHHLGRPINHDDTIGSGDLDTGLARTISAWQSVYSEDYLNPSSNPTPQNAPQVLPQPSSTHNPPNQAGPSIPRRQLPTNNNQAQTQAGPSRPPITQPSLTTADKIPPPGLTPAQLALWNYDVSMQETHEKADYQLRQARAKLADYNQKLAVPPPSSLLKRFADSSKRNTYEANRKAVAARIKDEIRLQDEFRAAWGRKRWPLLVQARGWGDMVPTKGQFRREPQGSTSLDFPIYAATWYDRKELGYYDYVSGGRGGAGAIDGGGLAVGGGMCGGRFDGGNCSTVVPRSNYNTPGCAGGGGG
ncbi:hypothetical protein V8E51_012035 [Hyaloscypha variabilis]